MPGRDDRTHVDVGLEPIAQSQAFRGCQQPLAQRLVRRARGDDHTAGETALTGAAEQGLADVRNGSVHVGVGHHDHVILRAAERLHALAVLRGFQIDEFRDRRTADERNAGDSRVREQRVDGVFRAMDHVEHARRDAGLVRQLDNQRRRKRHLFTGLQDKGVAGRDRVRPEPAGHHSREVEGRDRRKHAQRLAHVLAVDARRDVLEGLAHHERRNPTGVLDVLDAAAH